MREGDTGHRVRLPVVMHELLLLWVRVVVVAREIHLEGVSNGV